MRISFSSGVGWRNVDRFLFFIPSSVKKCGWVVPQNRSILLRPVICRYRRTRPKYQGPFGLLIAHCSLLIAHCSLLIGDWQPFTAGSSEQETPAASILQEGGEQRAGGAVGDGVPTSRDPAT